MGENANLCHSLPYNPQLFSATLLSMDSQIKSKIFENLSAAEANEPNEKNATKLKIIMEGKKRVDLPSDCRIPSKSEIEKTNEEFNEYANTFPWTAIARAKINKLNSQTKKLLEELSHHARNPDENVRETLVNQWLASIWHKNANRNGSFGNRQWNFCSFEIMEKLDDGLFACRSAEGKIFVLYSQISQGQLEKGYFTFFTVLVDVGGWFLTYGPVMSWKAFMPFDFIYIAKKVSKQTYNQEGFSAAVHTNSAPFWNSLKYTEDPSPLQNGKIGEVYTLECRFKNNTPPDFEQLFPKEKFDWKNRKSQTCLRWLFNNAVYTESYGVYFDQKTSIVLLFAHSSKDFDTINSALKPFIQKFSELEHSTFSAIASLQFFLNKKTTLEKFEDVFGI